MVSIPTSHCHPAGEAWQLLCSVLLLTVAGLGAVRHIIFLGCDIPPGDVPVAQELPSPDGACSLAHHQSAAPVVAFPCSARGKQERYLHRGQLENPSVLHRRGPSPPCVRLSVSVPFPSHQHQSVFRARGPSCWLMPVVEVMQFGSVFLFY